uniref:Metalloendopeptidase n=1 Tax=Meloidogyne javanica TaxID=6303 RepID=A0A915M3V5_MELJA
IDSWLRPDPESRNKRSVKDSSKLIERDEDGYVSGCENATTPIAYGDVFVTLEQLLNDIEYYKKSAWTKMIEDGLKLISQKTCIKFEKLNNSMENKEVKHLKFLHYGWGCGTLIGANGYNTSLEHSIYLDIDYCVTIGTVAHEVMHALGFHHEMIRADRNGSVWINFKDISDDMKRQYHRVNDTKQFNQRYDYGSVMHYPPEDYRSGMYVFRGPVLLLREPCPGC